MVDTHLNLEDVITPGEIVEFITQCASINTLFIHSLICTYLQRSKMQKVLYIDIDHRYDESLLTKLRTLASFSTTKDPQEKASTEKTNVDTENLVVIHPSSVDELFQIIDFFRYTAEVKTGADRSLRGTEGTELEPYILIIDSLLSLPYKPHRSDTQKTLYQQPLLSCLFARLLEWAKSLHARVICVSTISSQKNTAFIPYRSRKSQIFRRAPQFARTVGEDHHKRSAMLEQAHPPRSRYLYNIVQYPRWFGVDERQYIRLRMFVRYARAKRSDLAWIRHVNVPQPLFQPLAITSVRSPCLVNFDGESACALELIPHKKSASLRKQFPSHAPIRFCCVKGMQGTAPTETMSIREFHEDNYNELMIGKSQYKSTHKAATEGCTHTNVGHDITHCSVEPFWRSVSRYKLNLNEPKKFEIAPPFIMWNDMMLNLGGIRDGSH